MIAGEDGDVHGSEIERHFNRKSKARAGSGQALHQIGEKPAIGVGT
jgi:hypothetical protein